MCSEQGARVAHKNDRNEKDFLSNLKQDHFDFENAYTEEMLNGDSRTKYARTSSSTYDDEQDNSRIVIIQDLEVKNLRFTKNISVKVLPQLFSPSGDSK